MAVRWTPTFENENAQTIDSRSAWKRVPCEQEVPGVCDFGMMQSDLKKPDDHPA